MATPQSFIDRLQLRDIQDLRRELGRSHHDLGDCLLAHDASVMLDVLSRLTETEIARIIAGEDLIDPEGNTPPMLLMMVAHIKDATEALKVEGDGTAPSALQVLKRVREKFEWQVSNAGDYLTFLAYVEFLFRRWENPGLTWKQEQKELGSVDGRNALFDRIAEWNRNKLDEDLAEMEQAEDDAAPLPTATGSTDQPETENPGPSPQPNEGEWR